MLLSAESVGLSTVVSASIQRTALINPDAGSSYIDAGHVAILMQQNHSIPASFFRHNSYFHVCGSRSGGGEFYYQLRSVFKYTRVYT